jgi:hypothetical protein
MDLMVNNNFYEKLFYVFLHLISTDFAIAAPYAGSGIVYIYRGSNVGLVLSQRIVGSELVPNVAGFGFGISRGQDIDKNGYNGLF